MAYYTGGAAAGLLAGARFPSLLPYRVSRPLTVTASSLSNRIRSGGAAVVLTASSFAFLFSKLPALAETPGPPPSPAAEAEVDPSSDTDPSPLSQLLDTNPSAPSALRTLLYQKLEAGDDAEALSILNRLISAQPSNTDWKFLAARLLNDTGDTAESRKLFEEILAVDPLSFEALFENAVLMDRFGEGPAVLSRLDQALHFAQTEGKEKAARDVKLIMAQIQFLQKNVEDAIRSYEELAREDPEDYRPYFCRGVIYSLLERNKEAREMFAKYHELSPRKFDVDVYLQTAMSRMKLFGTEEPEI